VPRGDISAPAAASLKEERPQGLLLAADFSADGLRLID
jgi:hypothetical protein